MSTIIKNQTWEGHGASVRGASHEKTGLRNQDAWDLEATSSTAGTSIILAVADGHGNPKSFRSDLGAKLAVKVATKALGEFANAFAALGNLGAVERAMESDLPRNIVQRWQDMVAEHFTANPFAELEFAGITHVDRKQVEQSPSVAYGATLVTVLLTDRFIGYLQLGDGDVLVVSEKGEVRRPLPADERLIANETTSLCSIGSSGGAWVDFRTKLVQTATSQPVLILVSTDGYKNSFRTDADYLRVGSDICEMLRSNGLEYVKTNLEAWLAEASMAGSGDDITVGFLSRLGVATETSPTPVKLTPAKP